jgi:hypothetical protein
VIEVKLNNEAWEVHLVDKGEMPAKTWGDCCLSRRRIRVRRDLSEANVLDTLIHELRHALEPFLAEEFVDSTSTTLSQALTACGVRLELGE